MGKILGIYTKGDFKYATKISENVPRGKLRAYIRERRRGNSINYEVRCRMDGICISAGGTTKEEARKRFIEKLNVVESGVTPTPTKFGEFIKFYFENFRKRKVVEQTYLRDVARVKKHVLPVLGEMCISAITPSICQNLIDGLSGKTAEEVFSLLSQTFKCAIAHRIVPFSPLDTLLRPSHERKHGHALTKQEERQLLETSGKYTESFAIALYTGMRPNEYETVRREGDLLIAKNSKRKGKKIEYKRIPINPMLRPYISDSPKMATAQTLRKNFKKLFPDKILYDLRTTFNTRCVECKVDNAARKLMMGHSLWKLANAYTDVSDEFLITEANKIAYDLPPILPPK